MLRFSLWHRHCPTVRAILLAAVIAGFASRAFAQTTAAEFAVLRNMAVTEGVGVRSNSRLIQASNGMIYGVKHRGGANNFGTLFRSNVDGSSFAVLRHFGSSDGTYPAAILQSRDGTIYGVTDGPGPAGALGSIFRMNLDGTGYVAVHRFTSPASGWIPAMLLEGTDGLLYGTCLGQGDNNHVAPVVLFRINRDGTAFTILRTLTKETEGGGSNGVSGTTLVQGPDGRLYGSARGGGTHGRGTLFRLNVDGSGFTVLRQLTDADGSSPNRLLITSSGKIYGTAYSGGTYNYGTIFRLNLDGSDFRVLHHLVGTYPPPSAGTNPMAGLTEASDGLLYGVTLGGGELRENGTLFRINPADGSHMLLRSFLATDGSFVHPELLLASNGKLYGISSAGGSAGHGTLFSYTIAKASNSVTATVGTPFIYSTAALVGVATNYFALGLPSGLVMDEKTGQITGTPQQAGSFGVALGGSGSGSPPATTLALTVQKSVATITVSGLSHVYDGAAKTVAVTTLPTGLLTTTTYNGIATAPSNPGTYAVAVLINDPNYTGGATATLTIGGAAPRITAQNQNPDTVAGTEVRLTAAIEGTVPFTHQWQRKPAGGSIFANVSNDSGFAGATTATLSVLAPTFGMDGDQFRLIVTNALGEVVGEPVVLTVHPSAVLTNVSIRARVSSGSPLTVGFVTNGERPMLIRAVGPGLASFLERDAVVAGDPGLVLGNPANPRLAVNDNWGGSPALATSFASVGAFALPANSADAALVSMVSGSATTQMSVTSTGLGLIEVYDTGSSRAARVVNLSALYEVGSGADALVAGFTISGTGSKRLLVRGVGPALRTFGVLDALSDPRIVIFTAAGLRLVENEDWPATLTTTMAQAGAFVLPPGSKDAALLLNAPPGTYTVQLSGADGSSGQGLIELYELRQP